MIEQLPVQDIYLVTVTRHRHEAPGYVENAGLNSFKFLYFGSAVLEYVLRKHSIQKGKQQNNYRKLKVKCKIFQQQT